MRYKTILLLVLSAWGIMACQNYTDKIAVEIRQPVYPVLTLKEHNPVLCLRLIRNSGVAYQLEKINFTLDGTVRSGDVVSASLFLDENCGQVCASAKPVNKQLSFKVGRQIEEDTLTCWVTLRLRDDAAQATSKIEISSFQRFFQPQDTTRGVRPRRPADLSRPEFSESPRPAQTSWCLASSALFSADEL